MKRIERLFKWINANPFRLLATVLIPVIALFCGVERWTTHRKIIHVSTQTAIPQESASFINFIVPGKNRNTHIRDFRLFYVKDTRLFSGNNTNCWVVIQQERTDGEQTLGLSMQSISCGLVPPDLLVIVGDKSKS